jgi:hypothetical protein
MQEFGRLVDRETNVRAMRPAALTLGPVGLILAGTLIAADGDAPPAPALAGGALTTAETGPRAYEQLSLTLGQAEYRQIADGRTFYVPELRTGEVPGQPALSHQVIRPYTDLLLHDMGEGLADNRPDFEASGREWRTPPLWGIGLTQAVNGNVNYLHDGRARTLTEAILWHGGEAAAARDAFKAMARTERDALLRFLESL